MKKYAALIMLAVLSVTLFTGCGCRNTKPVETTMPTMPSTAPTTQPTTAPSTPTTAATDPTIEDGNGPMPTTSTDDVDWTTSTENTESSKSRNATESTEFNDRTNRNRAINIP